MPGLGKWDVDEKVQAFFVVTDMNHGVYAEIKCPTCTKIIEAENEMKTGKKVPRTKAISTWLLPLQLVKPDNQRRKTLTTFELLPYPQSTKDQKRMKATIIDRWDLPNGIDLKSNGWKEGGAEWTE